MNFYRLEYFLVLAETLNYMEASKQLYISPQALSKQIMILEKEIGDKLFIRTTRSVKLTDLGEICYKRFLQIKEQYDSALNEIKEYVDDKKKTIRIGFLSALPKNEVITPILQIVSETFPKFNIDVVADELEEVRNLLEDDKIDLCITNIHEYEHWKDCSYCKLATFPAKIVMSLYHPWVMKDKITEEDIQNAEVILYKKSRPLETHSFYKNLKCKKKHYANNFDSLLATLEVGKDIAVIPKAFDYMYRAKFKYYDLPEKLKFEYHTAVIYKKENYNINIENLLNNLKEEIKLESFS